MKRTALALLVGAVVFAGIYGLAASLNLSSDSLGAGSSVVAACQSGTATVSYSPTYSASLPGYQTTTVTLGNLDTSSSGCGGKAVRVSLTGPSGSNALLGEQTGTVPTSGSTMTLSFAGVKASDVTGVHVVIGG
jgi:hypothetical protein